MLASCGGESSKNGIPPEHVSVVVSGKAQKGPFIKGASIVFTKLKANAMRDSRFVEGSVIDSTGKYKVQLNWVGWTEIKVTGRFFKENNAKISPTEISLLGLIKINPGATSLDHINVNLFTHFVIARTRSLLGQDRSLSIEQAHTRSRSDIKVLFSTISQTPESLDLSQGSGALKRDNAVLLLFSGSFSEANGDSTLLQKLTDDVADNAKVDGAGKQFFETIANNSGKPGRLNSFAKNLRQLGEENPPTSAVLPDFPHWVNLLPVVILHPNNVLTIKENEYLRLDASNSRSYAGELSFLWEGVFAQNCGNTKYCDLPGFPPGEYPIKVTVTDQKNNSDSEEIIIRVIPQSSGSGGSGSGGSGSGGSGDNPTPISVNISRASCGTISGIEGYVTLVLQGGIAGSGTSTFQKYTEPNCMGEGLSILRFPTTYTISQVSEPDADGMRTGVITVYAAGKQQASPVTIDSMGNVILP